LIAVCAILLSPTFSSVKFKEQVKKEQSSDTEKVFVQAPSDAIPGSAVKVDQPAIPLLTQIEEVENKQSYPVVRSERVTRYLKLLFRTIIAPNAP
jgi:hypothetical protein